VVAYKQWSFFYKSCLWTDGRPYIRHPPKTLPMTLLARISTATGDRVILWRGPADAYRKPPPAE